MRTACRRVSALPSGQPLHGDAHLRNVLWTPEGPLWGDLENACSGPVEFDLASLLWRGMPGSDEALAAYGDHDPALVEAAEPALTLCLAAWTLVIANRVATEGANAEARRRVERALAHSVAWTFGSRPGRGGGPRRIRSGRPATTGRRRSDASTRSAPRRSS